MGTTCGDVRPDSLSRADLFWHADEQNVCWAVLAVNVLLQIGQIRPDDHATTAV
jgi:hypothetical protein